MSLQISSRLSFIVAIVLFLAFSTSSKAEIGSMQEVIKAAKEGKEPAYIKELMARLSRKLHDIAREKGIASPKEKSAWLITMGAVLNASHKAVWNPTGDASFDAAHSASELAVWHPGWIFARSVAGDVAGENTEIAIQNMLRQRTTIQQAEAIAFREAEWLVLNFVFSNAENIVETIYEATLNALPEKPEKNPFDSREAFIQFYNQYFFRLSDNVMIFIAPWLISILPLDWIPEVCQPLFLRLSDFLNNWPTVSQFVFGRVDDNSLVHLLPKEVVWLVLMLAIQVPYMQIGK